MAELDKRAVRRLITRARLLKNRIAKDRDDLRDLASDLEDIASGSDEAVEALDRAADAMSRLV